MKRATQATLILLGCAVGFAACTKKEEAPNAASQTQTAAPAAGAPAAGGGTTQAVDPNKKPDVEVTIGSQGNNLAFDKNDFTAKAGQTVRITMKNNATPDSNMLHNVVVTKPGTETDVANAGIAAGEAKNYVEEGPNVVAHTALAKPGASESVTFVAPAPGSYPYICTFPGHSVTMKGTMKVE